MIFEAVLSNHPQLARATFYKGLVMHERKSHAAALTLYRRAAESGQAFPERDRLPYYAAWSAYYTGKPDEARTMIRQYIENVPDQADAHYLAGVLELDADNTEAAKVSLQRAIELASVDLETERTMARGWVRLADVHISAGELDDALVAVNRAVELRPSLTEAWFRKYTVLMRLGDEDAAEVARERWKALSSVDNVSSGVLP
jgi:tetratricopeptide (TPR) repeat protein